MSTLFEKLGGDPALQAVVQKFYEIMLEDSRVNHYFVGIDMEKQRLRQKQFLTLVTGGPANYEGKDMKVTHCKLNITKEAFDATWENLEKSLYIFEVIQELVKQVKDIFYSVQEEIVSKKQKQSKQILTSIENKSEKKQESKKCPYSGSMKKEICPFTKPSQNSTKLTNEVYKKLFY